MTTIAKLHLMDAMNKRNTERLNAMKGATTITAEQMLDKAIKAITKVLPIGFETDDYGFSDGDTPLTIRVCVYDYRKMPGRWVDTFIYIRDRYDSDTEAVRTFNRKLKQYADEIKNWRW